MAKGHTLHLLMCTWKLFFQGWLRLSTGLVVSYLGECRTRHHLLKRNRPHRSTLVFRTAHQYSTVHSHRCRKCISVCQPWLKSEKEHLCFQMWILVLTMRQLQLEMLTGKQASKADFSDLHTVTAWKTPSIWQKRGRPGSPGIREEQSMPKNWTKSLCIYAVSELYGGGVTVW